MRSALSILLNGPVYHMVEVFTGCSPEIEFWNAAGRGKKTNEEWKQFFEGRGFRAGDSRVPQAKSRKDAVVSCLFS